MQKPIPSTVAVNISDLQALSEHAHKINLSSRQPQKSPLFGRHASLIHGRGLDFKQVRQYVRGDDVRHIDWKVTARTQQPHLKQFSEERERPVLLILNQGHSMFFGSTAFMKSVVAAQLAAIVAHHVVKAKDQIGAIIVGDESSALIRPKGGTKNLMQVLQQISEANQALLQQKNEQRNEYILAHTMAKIKRLKPVNHLIIFISDIIHYMPEVKTTLMALSRHNDLVVCKVNDPLEFKIPQERWVLSNKGLQIPFDTGRKNLAARYAQDTERRCKQFVDELQKQGIPVLKFNSLTSAAQQLKQYFGT